MPDSQELDSTALQDAVFQADIDNEDYVPPEEGEKENTDNKTDDKDTPVDDKLDDKADKITELESRLTEAQKEINRLGYALRKGEKTKENKETPFTKAQLFNLYKEYKDNPEVVFQIMEEMSKQGKVDAQEAAEKSVDIKSKKTQMDTFIESIYPDVKKEGSELHTGIQKTIEWAHLEGHPFAEHLALGLLTVKNLPETIKKIKEDTKKEIAAESEKKLTEKAEDFRKKNINANKLYKSKASDSDKQIILTPEQMDTAKRLGFTKKDQLARYARMIGAKGTVQAET